MNLVSLVKQAEHFTIRNSPTILTSIGVAGTVATAYLTGKATVKAVRILEDERHKQTHPSYPYAYNFEPMDVARLVWTLYIPPVATGTLTVVAIIGANHISGRRAAGLAAAYSISERAFSEYREKVIEKVGEKKERDYRDEVAQERVARNPAGDNTVIVTDTGEVLCFDHFTGRYFKSSMESLRKAENDINHQIINDGYASLSEFYGNIGIKPTAFSDTVGWNTDYMLAVVYSTVLSDDGKPCIAIDFDLQPSNKFSHFSG